MASRQSNMPSIAETHQSGIQSAHTFHAWIAEVYEKERVIQEEKFGALNAGAAAVLFDLVNKTCLMAVIQTVPVAGNA
jgi:hypothetical protein